MNKVPFVPLGAAIICKKLTTDMTRGGVLVPESIQDKGESIVVCEVMACPEGSYSDNGVRIPPEVQVGDVIAMPMQAAKKITMALKDELISRGVEEEDLKDMFVAFIPTVLGKFVGDKFDRSGALAELLKLGADTNAAWTDTEIRNQLAAARTKVDFSNFSGPSVNPVAHDMSK